MTRLQHIALSALLLAALYSVFGAGFFKEGLDMIQFRSVTTEQAADAVWSGR